MAYYFTNFIRNGEQKYFVPMNQNYHCSEKKRSTQNCVNRSTHIELSMFRKKWIYAFSISKHHMLLNSSKELLSFRVVLSSGIHRLHNLGHLNNFSLFLSLSFFFLLCFTLSALASFEVRPSLHKPMSSCLYLSMEICQSYTF